MEKKRLGAFLKRSIEAFSKGDIFGLRGIANQAIEEAALSNDHDLARLALIAYCVHKMNSKEHFARHDRWREIKHDILFDLKKADKSIRAGQEEEFNKNMNAVIDSVNATDKKMGNYVQNLFEKAKVKYASDAYSLGLGLGQAAALTGANKKDLLRYIGVTRIADRETVTLGIGKRLSMLKRKMGEKK